MRLAPEILRSRSAGEDAHHSAQTSVASCLQVERCISYRHDLRDAIDLRRFHRMEEHKWRGPPLRDIVTANRSDEIFFPAETAEDRRGDRPIETRGGGDQITLLTQLADRVFGA